ncbi:MAG: 50S ribosomal protein L21 [Acidobacteria bacterium]|nr:50S ribosomal protein L21 [Acidobacteriota bacterium]
MYAIIETGGRQIVASPGEVIRVESLVGEPGEAVSFDRVIAVSQDNGTMLSGPDAQGVRVTGVIEDHGRGKKVKVFKFKRRKMFRWHKGHRQNFTAVKIDAIAV